MHGVSERNRHTFELIRRLLGRAKRHIQCHSEIIFHPVLKSLSVNRIDKRFDTPISLCFKMIGISVQLVL